MKIVQYRKSQERGFADHGWLQSYHSFSFADYYDPKQMGFSVLRVINEDFIAPGMGFPMHSHRDMEIITYIIQGQLSHKDSLGNSSTILPGEIQRMSAGPGIRHSEFNPDPHQGTHLLQIWILPRAASLPSGYEQKVIRPTEMNTPKKIASERGGDGSVCLQQDVELWALKSSQVGTHTFAFQPRRCVWIQVISGSVTVGESSLALNPGDALGLIPAEHAKVSWTAQTEFLMFDLPL